jgi:hypothetical protein
MFVWSVQPTANNNNIVIVVINFFMMIFLPLSL